MALATGAWYDPVEPEDDVLDVAGNPNAVTLDKNCSGLSHGHLAHTTLVFVESSPGPLPPLLVDRPRWLVSENCASACERRRI